MDYPQNATSEEKTIDWVKIAEISDQDFGFTDLVEKSSETRFNTRILLTNEKDEICVIKSKKHGYTQIPGGGIEDDESILDGLRRETEEETGYLIDNIKPIGYVIEHRESAQNHHSWNRCISYVFTATPSQDVGTKYMPDEIEEGFTPIWVSLDDLIEAKKQVFKDGAIDSYSGNFSNLRDLYLAEYYLDWLKNNRKELKGGQNEKQ